MVKRLAKQAPDTLEASFESLLGFYDLLESNAGDSRKIIEDGRKAAKAGRRIAKYLKKTCNVDVEPAM